MTRIVGTIGEKSTRLAEKKKKPLALKWVSDSREKKKKCKILQNRRKSEENDFFIYCCAVNSGFFGTRKFSWTRSRAINIITGWAGRGGGGQGPSSTFRIFPDPLTLPCPCATASTAETRRNTSSIACRRSLRRTRTPCRTGPGCRRS